MRGRGWREIQWSGRCLEREVAEVGNGDECWKERERKKENCKDRDEESRRMDRGKRDRCRVDRAEESLASGGKMTEKSCGDKEERKKASCKNRESRSRQRKEK